jgi:hypothetical protein
VNQAQHSALSNPQVLQSGEHGSYQIYSPPLLVDPATLPGRYDAPPVLTMATTRPSALPAMYLPKFAYSFPPNYIAVLLMIAIVVLGSRFANRRQQFGDRP